MIRWKVMLLAAMINLNAKADDLWQGFEEFKGNCPSCWTSPFAGEIADTDEINDEDKELVLRIFVSSSMPLSSIRQYFKDSGKYKAILVLKGLPNNSFKQLTQFVQVIGSKERGNLIMDERLFEQFKVGTVPTIILAANGKTDQLVGNVTTAYALELFASCGELAAEAKQLLEEAGK